MIAPVLVILLLLSGCGSIWAEARTIDALVQVETVGLDPEERGVALSISAASPETRETVSGGSIRLAMDAMQQQTGSAELFYAHAKFLLLGQGTDIPAALDFVARSSDMRLRTPVVLLKNASAAEAVQLGGEDADVTAMLQTLKADMDQHGSGHAFTCGEALRRLSESGCALLAAAELEYGALQEAGYGILRDGICVGWIAAEDAAAVNLLLSLNCRSDILLNDGVTVTIENSRCKYSDGAVELTLWAELSETDGGVDITEDAVRKRLEKALSDRVLEQIRRVLGQCRKLDADLFGMGDEDVTITVRSRITRSLDLVAPIDLTGVNQ